MVGSVVSHYRILEKIGEGGMGVVYKARDSHLDRLVALKVLAADRVFDEDRRRRFVLEAKSASSLNNPHIVTIYDIDSQDGVAFIAMEYIDGKSLLESIPPRGLPAADAVKYAIQIADALAAVHARGIVHRDLKPGNVMVTRNSCAKVLDFGLAKLTEEPSPEGLSTVSEPPRTAEGTIVGTVAYMSPEQAEGKPVDARSDIFSFGSVLYHMLTGRPPFHGATKISTLSSILHDLPVPPSRINDAIPTDLERLVLCCLEKDSERRFQHAADLKMALEWLERDSESSREAPGASSRKRQPLFRNTAAALFLIGALATLAAVYVARLKPSPALPPSEQQITFDSGLTCSPSLSPDGKFLAYASDRGGSGNVHIWVQQLAGGEPLRLTNAPFDDFSPRFTPDGLSILFERTGAGIFRTPALGGVEQMIAPRGLGPHCSPDGTRLVYWVGTQDNRRTAGAVFVAPMGEGETRRLAPEFADARYPLWSPDGTQVLFQGKRTPASEPDWWLVPADGGAAASTGIIERLRKENLSPFPGPGDWVDGYLLLSARRGAERYIWTIAFPNPAKRTPGSITRLTSGIGEHGEPSAAGDGKVVFASYRSRDSLWLLPLNGGQARQGELKPLHNSGSRASHPFLSADAKVLAFLSGPPGVKQVTIRELPNGPDRTITIGATTKSAPVLAADGSKVAFSIVEKGGASIYVAATGNSQPEVPERICENCGEPAAWTRNGDGVLFTSGHPQAIWLVYPKGGARIPILQHPEFPLHDPRVSPDGRWIAFVAVTGADRSSIFVAPLRDGAATPPEAWIGVTDGSERDSKPTWLNSDTLIFFSRRDRFGCLWKQLLHSTTKRPLEAPIHMYGFHEFRRSPRTLYDSSFAIAVAKDTLVINLAEIVEGNIWSTSLPRRR